MIAKGRYSGDICFFKVHQLQSFLFCCPVTVVSWFINHLFIHKLRISRANDYICPCLLFLQVLEGHGLQPLVLKPKEVRGFIVKSMSSSFLLLLCILEMCQSQLISMDYFDDSVWTGNCFDQWDSDDVISGCWGGGESSGRVQTSRCHCSLDVRGPERQHKGLPQWYRSSFATDIWLYLTGFSSSDHQIVML